MEKLIRRRKKEEEYQPSGARGTRSMPATPHRLQNPKWTLWDPKMADGVWKGVYPWISWRFHQLLLNKFFDSNTPPMRKGRDVGEKGETK